METTATCKTPEEVFSAVKRAMGRTNGHIAQHLTTETKHTWSSSKPTQDKLFREVSYRWSGAGREFLDLKIMVKKDNTIVAYWVISRAYNEILSHITVEVPSSDMFKTPMIVPDKITEDLKYLLSGSRSREVSRLEEVITEQIKSVKDTKEALEKVQQALESSLSDPVGNKETILLAISALSAINFRYTYNTFEKCYKVLET